MLDFLSISATDILDKVFLGREAVLYILRCLVASLGSTY